jgi:hypothetical protein
MMGIIEGSSSLRVNCFCLSDGPVVSTQTPWMIFKCRKPMSGRYVTAQHFNGAVAVSLVEVTFFAL